MNEIKIKIQMNESVMYKFQLYHLYRKPTTIISTLLGVFTCIISISWILHSVVERGLVYLLFGFLLVFLPPFTIKQKSKNQVKRNKVFNKPMEYTINQKGIILFQQGNRGELKWEDCVKSTYALGNILIYTGKNMSIILPVNQFESKKIEVKKLITDNLPEIKTRGLKKLK